MTEHKGNQGAKGNGQRRGGDRQWNQGGDGRSWGGGGNQEYDGRYQARGGKGRQDFGDGGSQQGSHHEGSQHGGSQYEGSQYGGSQYGGSQHGGKGKDRNMLRGGHWDNRERDVDHGSDRNRDQFSDRNRGREVDAGNGTNPVAAYAVATTANLSAAGLASHDRRVYGEEENADFLGLALQHLDVKDIGGATRMLMRLAKGTGFVQRTATRADPRLGKILRGFTAHITSPDLTIWPRELADIAFLLGKLQFQDAVVSDLLRVVADSAKCCVEHFSPQDMAGIVWGFASLGFRNETLMSVIAAEVVNKASLFDQRQVSITAWAFAKCGLWNQQLVAAIAKECLGKMDSFSAQSLSHLSWALSQWGARMDELMSAIAEESQRKIAEFTPAPLAMTAWSFASLQLKDTELLTAISGEAVRTMDRFETRDLAHLAWAFANLRVQDAPLFDAMAQELQRTIRGTQPPELANIAWAFSKNNLAHESLMSAIAREAVSQIEAFKPAEVAMLTWAFAVAGLQDKDLMTQIGILVANRVETFTAPQLSHIAWAFGALALRHSEFLQVLSRHVQANVSVFKAQGLSNIAWAFAMVTFRDEPLLLRAAPCIARDAAELRPLALARCAWAYRVLMVQSPELFAAISVEATVKVDEFPTKALLKLVDSMYLSSVAWKNSTLEAALSTHMAEVARSLRLAGGHGEPGALAESYAAQLQEHGLSDCGIVGTPLLMSQLGIKLPGAAFMKRCRIRSSGWASAGCPALHDAQQAPGAQAPEVPKAQESLDYGCTEYTAAELRVTIGEQELQTWAVRHAGQQQEPQATEEPQAEEEPQATGGVREDPLKFKSWLQAVDMQGRAGQTETMYLALNELCGGLAKAGVDMASSEARAEVRGAVRVLSTVLPGLSSIGALVQFAVYFPNVTVEFVEQVGTLGES